MNSFLILTVVIFWAGFVSSISFMEAWLKFRVEGVTLGIGLSIGKKVFGTLNRVEWALGVSYAVLWTFGHQTSGATVSALSVLLFALLAIQTFYLLPRLDQRIDLIVAGEKVPKSHHHVYFVILELLKVAFLIALAYQWWSGISSAPV